MRRLIGLLFGHPVNFPEIFYSPTKFKSPTGILFKRWALCFSETCAQWKRGPPLGMVFHWGGHALGPKGKPKESKDWGCPDTVKGKKRKKRKLVPKFRLRTLSPSIEWGRETFPRPDTPPSWLTFGNAT